MRTRSYFHLTGHIHFNGSDAGTVLGSLYYQATAASYYKDGA